MDNKLITKTKEEGEKPSKRKIPASNISDYVRWRGDLEFSADGFNEVDNLILSKLVSFDFTAIVPPLYTNRSISLKHAAELYFSSSEEKANVGFFSPGELEELLKACAESNRFSGLELTDYVNQIDEKEEKQFCAMRIKLNNKLDYIAFRGTDDTLVGWKEDFKMSYLFPVPSQITAAEYLKLAEGGSHFRKIILGGHSKGGNLAVYAASTCGEKIRKKILRIYSNDGPGFEPAFFKTEGFLAVKDRICAIVPYESLVGVLMEQEGKLCVVRSRKSGPFQHDACMWEVEGKSFVRENDLSKTSRYWDKTINDWLNATSIQQRRDFIDLVFDVIAASGAKRFSDLTKKTLSNALKMFGELRNVDKESMDMAKKVVAILIKEGASNYINRKSTKGETS